MLFVVVALKFARGFLELFELTFRLCTADFVVHAECLYFC